MATATRERSKKQLVRAQFLIDYPRQDEKIAGAHYAFRISAPADAKKVEVAVDQGDWRPCRQAAGYWWYDWSGYGNGEHEIIARMTASNGKAANSQPHEFFVKLAPIQTP